MGIDLFSVNIKGLRHDFVITVDYWSNFFEIDELHSTEAMLVIRRIKAHFARHGVPDEVVTDNGPQFTSALFDKFAEEWMFQHT